MATFVPLQNAESRTNPVSFKFKTIKVDGFNKEMSFATAGIILAPNSGYVPIRMLFPSAVAQIIMNYLPFESKTVDGSHLAHMYARFEGTPDSTSSSDESSSGTVVVHDCMSANVMEYSFLVRQCILESGYCSNNLAYQPLTNVNLYSGSTGLCMARFDFRRISAANPLMDMEPTIGSMLDFGLGRDDVCDIIGQPLPLCFVDIMDDMVLEIMRDGLCDICHRYSIHLRFLHTHPEFGRFCEDLCHWSTVKPALIAAVRSAKMTVRGFDVLE